MVVAAWVMQICWLLDLERKLGQVDADASEKPRGRPAAALLDLERHLTQIDVDECDFEMEARESEKESECAIGHAIFCQLEAGVEASESAIAIGRAIVCRVWSWLPKATPLAAHCDLSRCSMRATEACRAGPRQRLRPQMLAIPSDNENKK